MGTCAFGGLGALLLPLVDRLLFLPVDRALRQHLLGPLSAPVAVELLLALRAAVDRLLLLAHQKIIKYLPNIMPLPAEEPQIPQSTHFLRRRVCCRGKGLHESRLILTRLAYCCWYNFCWLVRAMSGESLASSSIRTLLNGAALWH